MQSLSCGLTDLEISGIMADDFVAMRRLAVGRVRSILDVIGICMNPTCGVLVNYNGIVMVCF